jgi:branched-chain amino acid transport system ATP-binding protein
MLALNNISVFYDGLQAISAVSLTIQVKEFVSILGPNGAGKSTLLKTVAGLLVPKEGEIYFLEEPIHTLRPHQIITKGISLIPEEGWLFPYMDVKENLLMGAYLKASRKNVAEQMELVLHLFPRLRERRSQTAQTLSGGERQMLAIGRGLMANPRLLMLDEPSLGLAPMVIRDIFKILTRIHAEQDTTILLAEQNIYHALRLTQRGYVIENGRVAIEDRSEALLQNEHIKRNYLGL